LLLVLILDFEHRLSRIITLELVKVKVIPQQAEVSKWVPGRLRPRIILTFGTTRVVDRQPYAPASFIPGEILGTHFEGLSRPQGTWFRRGRGDGTSINTRMIAGAVVQMVSIICPSVLNRFHFDVLAVTCNC
jgi:hypothetical protein